MAEFSKYLFTASTADTNSEVMDTSRCDNLFVQLTVTVTSADLVATVAVGGALDVSGAPPVLPTLATPTLVSSPVSGVTLTSGVLTFATAAIGTHHFLLRVPEPPLHTQVKYDYTSGGGDVVVAARAFAWKHA